MEVQKKCFTEEHKEIDAISFCPECRIYMCNKCEKYHAPFFKSHQIFKLNKAEEIFTGFCQEKNHPMTLEYFCKDHNQLCCAACIAKINETGDGQHKNCEIYSIKKIKDEKMNKLKKNIKYLEDIENIFNENMKQLKEFFEKIEKDKQNLKIKIQIYLQK